MIKIVKSLALAAALTVGTAVVASAATLAVLGGTSVTFGTGNYQACGSGSPSTSCYNPSGALAKTLTETLSTYFSAGSYPGLTIVGGPAKLQITYLGKEAGYLNAAMSMGGADLVKTTDSIGTTYSFTQAANATVDFTFKTLNPTTPVHQAGSGGFAGGGGIALSAVFDKGRSVYAFYDDSGANMDRDWDDMVVKISIVPVPAAGFLLLGALGGLAALRRRKQA